MQNVAANSLVWLVVRRHSSEMEEMTSSQYQKGERNFKFIFVKIIT